jgi:hypothetical protein
MSSSTRRSSRHLDEAQHSQRRRLRRITSETTCTDLQLKFPCNGCGLRREGRTEAYYQHNKYKCKRFWNSEVQTVGKRGTRRLDFIFGVANKGLYFGDPAECQSRGIPWRHPANRFRNEHLGFVKPQYRSAPRKSATLASTVVH